MRSCVTSSAETRYEDERKGAAAGHLAELTHPPRGGRESYLTAFHILYRLVGEGATKFLVMFWGERYHCRV